MEQTENKQIQSSNALNAYCQRLEEIVSKRSAEFALINKMLTRESREHRLTEDGLLLRATILDNTGEAVFLMNRKGYFTYANETASTIYGYSRNEFLTMKLHQLLEPAPEKEKLESRRLEEVLISRQLVFETVHRHKDGSLVPVLVRYRLVRTAHGESIVGVVRDITCEMKMRKFLDCLPGIVWTTDANLKVTSVMGAGLEAIGMETCPFTGVALLEYLKENGVGEETLTAFQNALKSSSNSYPVEFNIFGKNLRGWVAPFRNSSGELIGTMSFLMDVTA